MNIIDPGQTVERIVEKLKADVAQRKLRLTSLSFSDSNSNGTELQTNIADKPLIDSNVVPLNLLPPFADRNLSHYTLPDLLAYDDVEFLLNAYQAILKRQPDAQGLANAIGNLRSGRIDKIDFLGELRTSEEGREKGVRIPGLQWRLSLRRFCRLPVVRIFALPIFNALTLPDKMKDTRQATALILHRQDLITNYINQTLVEPLRQSGGGVNQALKLLAVQQTATAAVAERISGLESHFEDRVNEEAIQRQQEFRDRTAEIEDLRRVYNKYRTQVELTEKALKQEMHHLFLKYQEVTTELVFQKHRMDSVSNQQTAKSPPERGESIDEKPLAGSDLDAFFASFEEHFRGNRDDVRERLKNYLSTLKDHEAGSEEAMVLDVACGRGEWLELLKEEHLHARGVDSNSVLAADCRKRGLDVTHADLVAYLKATPDNSLGAISAFHIVEHLALGQLVDFLDQTLRTLRAGGLLMLETPNPQNVLVGSCNFYLDPTHRNPLPLPVLRYFVESRGFIVIDTFGLNPSDEKPLAADSEVARRFNDYFYGPMDYAIVARKL